MKCGDAIKVIEGNEELKNAVDTLTMTIPVFTPSDLDALPDCIYDLIDDDIKNLIRDCLHQRVMDTKEKGKKEGKILIADILSDVCEKLHDKIRDDDRLRCAIWGVILTETYEKSQTDDEFETRIINLSKQVEEA